MDVDTFAGFKEIPRNQTAWNRLLSFVIDTTIQDEPVSGINNESAPAQHDSIKCSPQEYGKCEDYCYIVDGENKLVLSEGGEYKNPAEPCIVYCCTVSSASSFTFKARIAIIINFSFLPVY